MAFYTPTVGIITNIDVFNTGNPRTDGCTLFYTFQSEDQGLFHIILPPSSYVLNSRPLEIGDRVTFFYDTFAPVPLIFPPQYRALAAAHTPMGTSAILDVFNSRLTSSDNSLTLNITGETIVLLPNGQPFDGDPGNNLLLAVYGPTTRSIPAQTSPEQVVVFC